MTHGASPPPSPSAGPRPSSRRSSRHLTFPPDFDTNSMPTMNENTRRLFEIIDKFPHLRIAVWGDIILDEYLYGSTRRVSREAPVLILSYQRREFSLGGAGNALLNLKALGVEPVPVCVVGKDDAGKAVARILRRNGIAVDGLIAAAGYPTPLKTRILAGEENTKKQQVLRIDTEGRVPDAAALKAALARALRRAAKECDALIISDYHYRTVKDDVFADVLPTFKTADVPVTLDSRFRLLSFPGVTVATPNEPEVEDALKIRIDDDPRMFRDAGRALLRKLRSPALLITRGSKGMALFQKNKPPVHLPIFGSTDIVDVTGAGDTVISVFTTALACGAAPEDAASLANFAGGIVVMKKGTATVTPLELKQAVIAGH
jgi:rfaE bifunctional protein kinase chain/domain